MNAPINRMINSVVRCTICKAKMGQCNCWVKLRCPQCKRSIMAKRDPTDLPGTATVEVLCDRCDDGGGFPEVFYYNADGKQLLFTSETL